MTATPRSLNHGPVADAVADALSRAGLSGEATIVAAGMSAAELIHHLREAAEDGADSLIVAVQPGVEEPERTMLIAAIAPLAIAFAPATRLSLIDVGPDADEAAVIAAACFLATAASTTGQVVKVGR